MTKNEVMIIAGLVGVASAAVGYAIGQRKKLKDISEKIDKKIDEMSGDIDVNIDDVLVKKAVHKAVQDTVDSAVKEEAKKQAGTAISQYREAMRNELRERIEKGIDDTDISKIKQAVIDKASDKAARKVTEGLEYIFDDFRRNLRRVTTNTIVGM